MLDSRRDRAKCGGVLGEDKGCAESAGGSSSGSLNGRGVR